MPRGFFLYCPRHLKTGQIFFRMGEAIEWSVASTRLPNGAKAQKQIQLNRAGVFRNYLARLLVARTIYTNLSQIAPRPY